MRVCGCHRPLKAVSESRRPASFVQAMTDFKRATAELTSLDDLLSSLTTDESTPAPEKLEKLAAAKARTTMTKYRHKVVRLYYALCVVL